MVTVVHRRLAAMAHRRVVTVVPRRVAAMVGLGGGGTARIRVRGAIRVSVVEPLLPGALRDLAATGSGPVALVLRAGVSTLLHAGLPAVIGTAVVGVPAMAGPFAVGIVDVAVLHASVADVLVAFVPGLPTVAVLTVVAVLVTGVIGAAVVPSILSGPDGVDHVGVFRVLHALVAVVPHTDLTFVAHPGVAVVLLVAGPPEQGRRRGAHLLVEPRACGCLQQCVTCCVEYLGDIGTGTDAGPVSRLRDLRPDDVDGTGQFLAGSAEHQEQIRLRRCGRVAPASAVEFRLDRPPQEVGARRVHQQDPRPGPGPPPHPPDHVHRSAPSRHT
ncbi:MAG TPA: hypothetical protein VD926_11835 [Acidimicrobiales bacterium]|nr:hypothetical protein [Acidimicrobiales bacterium]